MAPLRSRIAVFPRRNPLLALVVAVIAVELVGVSGAVFTAQGLAEWYGTLRRPALAPPNWVFGPVWTTLFALKGIALWLVWRHVARQPRKVRVAVGLFVAQFTFNLGWSAAFFGAQNVALGLAVILVLWALILATIRAFDRVDRRAGLLLVPYLLWVTFAAFLNYRFWMLN